MMVGVKNQKDPRDGLHHGGWMMKIICWCLLVIFMFFLPNEIVSFYGKLLSSLDRSRKFFLLVSSVPVFASHDNVSLCCFYTFYQTRSITQCNGSLLENWSIKHCNGSSPENWCIADAPSSHVALSFAIPSIRCFWVTSISKPIVLIMHERIWPWKQMPCALPSFFLVHFVS